MKTLLKLTLLTAAFAAVIPAGNAATAEAAPATPDAHPRLHAFLARRAEMRQHVAKKLGLSAEQIAQLKSSRTEAASTLKAIRADTNLTAEQKKAKAREAIAAVRSKAGSVLTAEQKQKAHKLHAKVKKHQKQHKHHKRHHRRA
jgi:Spy/CpxP family protein refolding chaperone